VQTSVAHTKFSPLPRCKANTPCGGENPKKKSSPRSRTRIGFVRLYPLGKGFLTGKIHRDTSSTKTISAHRPSFTPEARKANQALVDLLQICAHRRKPRLPRSASPGCYPEAVDRSDPRHHQAASPRRKPRRRQLQLSPEISAELEHRASKIPVQGPLPRQNSKKW